MKNPNIMYILIGVFCVLAILAGIYAQFIDRDYGGLDLSTGGPKYSCRARQISSRNKR